MAAAKTKSQIIQRLNDAGVIPPFGLKYDTMSLDSLEEHAAAHNVDLLDTPTTAPTPPVSAPEETSRPQRKRRRVSTAAPTLRSPNKLPLLLLGGIALAVLAVLALVYLMRDSEKSPEEALSATQTAEVRALNETATAESRALNATATAEARSAEATTAANNLYLTATAQAEARNAAATTTAQQAAPAPSPTPTPPTDASSGITPTAPAGAASSYTYQWATGDLRQEKDTCYMMVSGAGETLVIDDSRAGGYATGIFNAGSKVAYDKAVERVQNDAINDPNNPSGMCEIIEGQ